MIVTNEFFNVKEKRVELKFIRYQAKSKLSPILMLHEGLGSISLWKDYPEFLANYTQRDILIYSRLGMGYSSSLKENRDINFMHDEALIYLKKIVAKYCTKEPILYGHSDGASIAIIYAGAKLPLKSLIIEAPHVFVEEVTTNEIKNLLEDWNTTNLKNKLEKYHKDVEGAFVKWCSVWLSDDFKSWNIESYVKEISVPTMIIQGLNDQYGSLQQILSVEKNIKSKLKKLLIKDCQHFPHIEFRDLVAKEIKRFINKLN